MMHSNWDAPVVRNAYAVKDPLAASPVRLTSTATDVPMFFERVSGGGNGDEREMTP